MQRRTHPGPRLDPSPAPRRAGHRATRAGALLAAATTLSACHGLFPGGAEAPAPVAARPAAPAVGGLLDAGMLARLDESDRALAALGAAHALDTAPIGTTGAWRSAAGGSEGRLTPTRTYQTASGQYCREFELELRADGTAERIEGAACRASDGAWQRVR